MNSVRPFQTKLMGVDQISQLRPNFTISAKFHNPGILGIPGVRAVSQFLRCFFFSKIRLLWYSIKYLVVFFNPTSYILNLNLHHILQLQHCLENLNSKVTNLSISLHARKQSTLLIQGSPINSGAQGTMRLSTQLELSKICKSKGLVFAQFWSKSGNSSCDWWKTLKILLEKYSNPIFAKNVISIGKKPVAGVWESRNLAHK